MKGNKMIMAIAAIVLVPLSPWQHSSYSAEMTTRP